MPFDYTACEAHFAALDTAGTIGEGGDTWHGPVESCDVCSRPMASESYMVDGPAQSGSQDIWGNLCVVCAFKLSPTIAWGRAQLYRREGEAWHLVAGGPPPEDKYDL